MGKESEKKNKTLEKFRDVRIWLVFLIAPSISPKLEWQRLEVWIK
jgi:hypothetical protein